MSQGEKVGEASREGQGSEGGGSLEKGRKEVSGDVGLRQVARKETPKGRSGCLITLAVGWRFVSVRVRDYFCGDYYGV